MSHDSENGQSMAVLISHSEFSRRLAILASSVPSWRPPLALREALLRTVAAVQAADQPEPLGIEFTAVHCSSMAQDITGYSGKVTLHAGLPWAAH